MSQFPPDFEPSNPYAPTSASAAAPGFAQGLSPELSHAEAIRRQYLSHEASAKSIGTLYLIGAFLIVPLGVGAIVVTAISFLYGEISTFEAAIMGVAGMLYMGIGLGQGATGLGLRRLRPWARIVAIVLSAIGLLGFPIGTLIAAYFLYILASQKGVYVFSDEYKQVILATPHIKYKTSIVVWIFLGLLLLLIGLGLIAGLVSWLSS